MNQSLFVLADYQNWLSDIKERVQSARLRVALASNLKYCLRFYQFYADAGETPFGQQLVDQIPWGHNILIFTKCSNVSEAIFYITQTTEQGWSSDVLALQLKSRLHERTGKAITNFSRTLPAPQSDLAQQTLKEPYTFGIMDVSEYRSVETLSNNLKEALPTVEAIEMDLQQLQGGMGI